MPPNPDERSFLHLMRRFGKPTTLPIAFEGKQLFTRPQEGQPPALPANTNDSAGRSQSDDAVRSQLSNFMVSNADKLGFRFDGAIPQLARPVSPTQPAKEDATTVEIASAMEALLQTEGQAEADQVESTAGELEVAEKLEVDSAPGPQQEILPSIAGAANQTESNGPKQNVHAAPMRGEMVARENNGTRSPKEDSDYGNSPHDLTAACAEPKLSRSADEISRLIHEGLLQIDGFPETGIEATVYGFGASWNAMLTFAPGSATMSTAMTYRSVLPDVVAELRKRVDLI
jgi:hypothetical protein